MVPLPTTEAMKPVDAGSTEVSRWPSLLPALGEITKLSATSTPIGAILDRLVGLLVEATGVDGCSCFVYDEATDTLALRAARGFNPAAVGALTIHSNVGIVGRAANQRETIAVEDAPAHPAFHKIPDMGKHVHRSQASTPMLGSASCQLVGVLSIFTRERTQFSPETLLFLEAMAREAGNAVMLSRQHTAFDERLTRKVRELGTLQRVSHMVAASLDLSDVLRSIAEASVELIDAEAAALFRVSTPEGDIDTESEVTIDYRVGELRPIEDEAQRTQLILQVIKSGAAQITEVDYVGVTNPLFCLPLRSGRETLGALCIRLRNGVELTEDELGLLQAFTDAATLAIQNARLYEEARESATLSATLLQEMHHRVRNNLQTVAALLSLQIRQDPDGPAAETLREAVNRIQSIAAVHDLVSDEGRFAGATVDVVARLVVDEVRATLVPPGLHVTFDIDESQCVVTSKQATIIALVINEVVANAIEHGFRNRTRGTVTIRSRQRTGYCFLEIENDGESLPPDFDLQDASGLGMRIVERLVASDLGGRFALSSGKEHTVARIIFPLPNETQLSPGAVGKG